MMNTVGCVGAYDMVNYRKKKRIPEDPYRSRQNWKPSSTRGSSCMNTLPNLTRLLSAVLVGAHACKSLANILHRLTLPLAL